VRDGRLATAARLQVKSEAPELAQAVGTDGGRVGGSTGSRELSQTIDRSKAALDVGLLDQFYWEAPYAIIAFKLGGFSDVGRH